MNNVRPLLKIIGLVSLLAGLVFAVIAPLEIYSFFFFTPGGPFAYEGFGPGSIMFANIVAQLFGYYSIALAGILIGAGHLSLQRWAYPSTETLLWLWLVVGLPLTGIALWIYLDTKQPSLAALLATIPFVIAIYPVMPLLMIRLYQREDVRTAFEEHNSLPSWLEQVPLAVRVLCVLLAGWLLILHVVLLMRGVFPLFGTMLSDLPGFAAHIGVMLLIGIFIWGMLTHRNWAWWGTLVLTVGISVSAWLSFPYYTFKALMDLSRVPPAEYEYLDSFIFLTQPITPLVVVPLLVTIGVVLVAGHSLGCHLALLRYLPAGQKSVVNRLQEDEST